MGQLIRFGRRVPLPSTVQIVHDLLVAQRDENAQLKAKATRDSAQDGPPAAGPDASPPVAAIPVPPRG